MGLGGAESVSVGLSGGLDNVGVEWESVEWIGSSGTK